MADLDTFERVEIGNKSHFPKRLRMKHPKLPPWIVGYIPGVICGALIAVLLLLPLAVHTNTSDERPSEIRESLTQSTSQTDTIISRLPNNNNHSGRVVIDKVGKYMLAAPLEGYVFSDVGRHAKIVNKVETSILKNLSPYIESEAKKSFIDPGNDQVYIVLAPAIVFHEGNIHLVCRVWLNKERYVADFFVKNKLQRTLNDIQDNWLYTQQFNTRLEPVNYGMMLGIPLEKNLEMSEGTLEPRMFQLRDRLFVTFNANVKWPNIGRLDTTFMYDLKRHDSFIPNVTADTPSAKQDAEWFPTDKAWMALVHKDELYFIHNLDPLWVMKCDLQARCVWVHKQKSWGSFLYQKEPYVGSLRGGTPFEHYRGNYYISIAHNTLRKGISYKRFYTIHLVVLHVNPFRVVYISNDILLHDKILHMTPMQPTKEDDMDESFIFPVGLIIEDDDSAVMGGHLNDMASVLLRITGLKKLMNNIISVDTQLGTDKSPPVGFLQNYMRNIHLDSSKPDLWFV